MIRKLVLRTILAFIFVAIISAISILFIADLHFNLAQKSEKNYLWQKAVAEYETAAKLDPFNSEYLSGYARFLYHLSFTQQDKSTYLEKAQILYNRAIKLNPENAGYYLGLGKVQLAQGKKDLDNFKKAVENDPNGFLVSYETGYIGIDIWKDLDNNGREFMLGRLKKVLEHRIWLSKYIYPRVLKITQDLKPLQYITPQNYKAQKRLYDFLVKNQLTQFVEEQKKTLAIWEEKK